jgi:hypothetical protein
LSLSWACGSQCTSSLCCLSSPRRALGNPTVRHNKLAPISTSHEPNEQTSYLYTPSGALLEVVLDNIWVKHWEYKSWIAFKSLSLRWKCKNHINRFVLKISFTKIYIYNFPVNIFIKKEVKVVLWWLCYYLKRLLIWNQREYIRTEWVVDIK